MLSGLGDVQISYDVSGCGGRVLKPSECRYMGRGQIVIWVAKMLYDASCGVG